MKTIIIAEAGVNHNGDLSLAKELICAASESGADFVKFQTFRSELLVSKKAGMAEYQKANIGEESSQFSMLRKLELDPASYEELIAISEKKNIQFLSTAFDLESLEFLRSLGLSLWKIPSGEITNFPYLKKIGSFNQDIILSSGMANLSDIENAIDTLEKSGTKREKMTVLHCNTEYPTPFEDVNLNAMNTIRSAFHTKVGYSDHTSGIEVAIAAVAMGATMIEKHFTLNRNMAGPDHKASLEPDELKLMVSSIRNIERAMGDGIKRPSKSEKKNIPIARKSIVASRNIKKDEVFSESNLTAKRPGDGLSPMSWDIVIGRIAKRDFNTDELIEL
ncbi:N-acetylneuraminate synthase [Leptospira alstonii]|uniref:N-acetylneuraminate synthase n=2 Tax=Leptospira alstonii TaxID=28452 RepID=M6CNH3_9LEPT|nr:N-acetylneuraminate synthase [Leptospira alstonii]EMJ92086.1 N-acetylneuraminate synthase [Leptospira alstonii serovar Sichuan str. 79601]EQA80263.1 N-acetylneuraminate synthase [Leptospira alstonii serovar Pingchang str. 80-412]